MVIFENSFDRYILEYPDKLHELHSDYPLTPEKIDISNDMLSKYYSNIAKKYGTKVSGVKKSIPNLGNKSKYIVHYRYLQLYLSLRMKLDKIRRVLKFKQFDWMKTYIDFNAEKRKNAANSFERTFSSWWLLKFLVKKMEHLMK